MIICFIIEIMYSLRPKTGSGLKGGVVLLNGILRASNSGGTGAGRFEEAVEKKSET